MYLENDKNKMRSFIQRLISNPSFNKEPELAIEENIMLFFIQNSPALKGTFSTQDYFPGLVWGDVQGLFQEILVEQINKNLIPNIQQLIQKKVNFQFLNILLKKELSLKIYQEEMLNTITRILKRFEIRRNMDTMIKVINYNLIDKYISQIFAKKSYISREIQIVERLKLSPDMISDFIKFIMFTSLLGYVRADMDNIPLQQKMKLTDIKFGNSYMQKTHYEKLVRQFLENSSIFTDDIIKKCIYFHLNFNEDKNVSATSRLAKIIFTMGKNFKPKAKLDKGADTYEKSWFQAQKKNYKYFGFDIDMLNELYRISAENYW